LSPKKRIGLPLSSGNAGNYLFHIMNETHV
jgi:hypothetical protein